MVPGQMTDLDVAIAVVNAGAAVLRGRFGTALARQEKEAGDFATDADVEAERAMLAILHRERPHDAVLAEESGHSGATESARSWLLDPLCGTLNYAAGMRVVAVNAALRASGAFVAAAVADPFAEETFWTDGVSAFRRAAGVDTPLAPSAASTLVDLNFDPPFPNAPRFTAVALASDPGFNVAFRPRVVSTSLALTWVATGQRAGLVTDCDARDSVHMAAGIAICEAAGCTVTNLHGGPWNAGAAGLIAAADAATHTALLGLVRRYLD